MAKNNGNGGMKKENKKMSSKKVNAEVARTAEEERKRCLLIAIASFFEKNGLSKSRESLLNEAQLEVAGLKVQLFNLEDVFYKFMESSCKDSSKETIMNPDNHENKKESSALSDRLQEHSKEAKRKRKHLSDANGECQQEIAPEIAHDECPLDNQDHDVKRSNTESKRKKKKIKLGMSETKFEDLRHCNTTEQPDHSNVTSNVNKNHTCNFEIPEGNKDKVGSKKIQESLSHIIEPDMETDKETKSNKKKKRSKSTSECFDSKIGENLDRNTSMNSNVKELISQNDTNSKDESIEKNTNDTAKKVKSKEAQSIEAKSISPFQRIKIDDVKFANEKLQDNSYWAKGGADNGYGAKAQEVLGQVRGRDFRHEKTKKKRGSYRGGQIDLQSHSIKFNYSDDE